MFGRSQRVDVFIWSSRLDKGKDRLLCLCRVIFVAFFLALFCGKAFLLLSYFKCTQIIGNDNEHWWQSITSPRWVPNRWQKETFYNWLSFASHSFCFEKENSEETKKHTENIQLWLWAAILEHHLHGNWPFTQCEQLTIEAFIYTCTHMRKQHAQRAHTDNLSLIFHLAQFSALIFATCSWGTLSLMMILFG